MQNKINSEDSSKYSKGPLIVDMGKAERLSQDSIIKEALVILRERMKKSGDVLTSPETTRNYLTLQLRELQHEVFGILLLDNRNQVIDITELFRGTIDGASVYPREVVKEVLKFNAAAVIFYHNHPSGVAEPSQADIRITDRLKNALELIDVRVLDHVIIGDDYCSFAERGLI